MTPEATADVQLRTHVFTSAARVIGGDPGRTFSPSTSTLVTGDTQAVLIDAQFTESEITALGDMIEQTGKALTTIYITHGHYDHYLRPRPARCPISRREAGGYRCGGRLHPRDAGRPGEAVAGVLRRRRRQANRPAGATGGGRYRTCGGGAGAGRRVP